MYSGHTGSASFDFIARQMGFIPRTLTQTLRSQGVAITRRQVDRWMSGQAEAPARARDALVGLCELFHADVEQLAVELAAQAPDERSVTRYRTDEGYVADGGTMPAGWRDAVVAAAINALPVGNQRCRIDWKGHRS